MKLLHAIFIPAERDLQEAPSKTERYGTHYELIIGIGKDHVAHLTLDQDALIAFNAGEKLTI